jgi:hypothetical protein
MAFTITQDATSAINRGVIVPQIVLKIDGFDLFTSAQITEVSRYGAPGLYYGMPGLVYGGTNTVNGQDDLISLQGTTTQITQQVLQDQGAASSTTNMTIALVNKDNALGSLPVTVGLDDILSKKAEVYLGVAGTNYPDDFLRIFVGNITEINTSAGLIKLRVAHPEHLKRADLFQQIQTELTSAINNSVTTIPVLSTNGMLLPGPLFKTYVRIDDEIIRYTGMTSDSLTGCTRAQFDTIAVTHDIEASTQTFYVLGDGTADSNAIDLCLRVLMSGTESPWKAGVAVSEYGQGPDPETINSLFLPGVNLSEQNVYSGDTVTVTGATTPGNNVTDALITSVSEDASGSLVTLDAAYPLTAETSSSGVASFKTQYNTLPDGAGLTPDQVDIDEFISIKSLFQSSLPFYEMYLKDTISGKDLINKEIMYPAACYSIPRKGRVSIGKTKPPILKFESKTLDESTVLNAASLSIDRSVLDNFYNAVIYKFNEDAVEDKFTSGRVVISENSFNRITSGVKPFLVESKGIRKTTDNLVVIENNTQRILDRYQFGAESLKGVKVPFSVGWGLEVGDTCVIKDLQLLDSKTGERGLAARVMEVTNRSFNFKTGEITIDIVDTAYGVDGRYGVISPSSQVTSASTSSSLVLKKSFSTTALELERDKWLDYVGLRIKVRSADFTDVEETVFTGFSPGNSNILLVDPPLSFTPSEDYIIEVADYDTADDYNKIAHVYFNPQLKVTANAGSETVFDVSDGSLLYIGCVVRVHSFDYVDDSVEAVVTNIVGDTITVDRALGFNPQIDDEVDLIGFVSDQAAPYRIL